MKKYIIIGILINLFPIYLFSQAATSLKELVNQALENNYQIKILKNEEIKLENSNSLGMAGFYPVLTLDGTKSLSNNNTKQTMYTGDIRQSNNATSDVNNASINLNWNFFDGFKMFATKSKLNYLEQIGQANTRFFIEETIFDIASAYYQLIKEIEKLSFLEESIKFSKDRLILFQEKLRIGNANSFDMQTAEYDFNQDSILILIQKELIKQLNFEINSKIIKQNDKEIIPTEKIQNQIKLVKENVVNQAFKNNTSLSLSKIRNLIANQDIAINKSLFYPDLTAFAGYNFQDQTNTVSIYRSNRSYGLNYGLRFSLNLYNGNQDEVNLQNSKIEAENTELLILEKEFEIRNLIDKSFLNYQTLSEINQLEKRNSELASNSVEIAKKQLETGAINSFDFRQIQLNYMNSTLKSFETEYAIKIKELELLKIGGILLNTIMQ
jgi:outer membrane protein TolC